MTTGTPLPTPGRPTLGELVRFDLRHGLPTAWRVLRGGLSRGRSTRVVAHLVRHGLRDPLASLPRTGWGPRREALVRHQLRAAVRLDDALRAASGLDEAERHALLADVIAETGARFIEANVPMPATASWTSASVGERARYTHAVVQRFFNADVADLDAGASHFAFDVRACRFTQLCAALGRPGLAPLFCEADARFFSRPASPLHLLRTETLARGGERCDFRFQVR